MYTPRFRERNTFIAAPGQSFSNWDNRGNCNNPIMNWQSYYSDGVHTRRKSVQWMDDVIGDRPKKKQGLAGYRFHPMTSGRGWYDGDEGQAQWVTRLKQPLCNGYASKYNTLFRRDSTGYQAAYEWSGLAFPMIGERLDLERLPYPYSEVERLRGLCETEVLAKRGKYGESNLFESIGEVSKSLSMLPGLFKTAARVQDILFKDLKKSKGQLLTDELAGTYLMMRYGFKPLVQDISAILVGLEVPLGKLLKTTRAQQTWTDNQTISLSPIADANAVQFNRTMIRKQKLSVRSMSLDSVAITMYNRLGLGIKDFVSVPWEFVPYSFVVDWFANVGNFLNALVPDVDTLNLGMCTTVRWELEETVAYGYGGIVNPQTELVSASAPGAITRHIDYKTRTVGHFVPVLRWQSDFRFDTLTRVLDALSLVKQKTKNVQQGLGLPTAADSIRDLRMRNPSQRGRRAPTDFY